MTLAAPTTDLPASLTESGQLRIPTRGLTARLPIIYKLWLALLPVQLLGLLIPSGVFLQAARATSRSEFEKKWVSTLEQICADEQILASIRPGFPKEKEREIDQRWQVIARSHAVSLNLGFIAAEGQIPDVPGGTVVPTNQGPELMARKDDVDNIDSLLEAFDRDAQSPLSVGITDLSAEELNQWLFNSNSRHEDFPPNERLEMDPPVSYTSPSFQYMMREMGNGVAFRIVARCSRLSRDTLLKTAEGKPALVVADMIVSPFELNNELSRSNFYAILGVLLGAVVLLPAVHFSLSSLVVGPLQSLARTMRTTTPETLGSLHVPVTRADEIGELQIALNLLAREISSRQRALNEYNDQLEERVHARTSELERSNQELDAFAYTVSHDLQAPLRNVSYIVGDEIPDAIRKGNHEEAHQLIQEVKRLCEFNIQMVRGLLDWARIGRSATKIEPLDLQQVISDVKSGLRTQLDEQHVQFTVANDLPVIYGDRMQWHRVLTNLVSNAIKYNDKPVRTIEIGWQQQTPHGTAIFVRDNGIGVRPHHMGKLFNLLVQLHDRGRYGEGVGMGLAIVKKIVDSYHGTIWPESVHGQGTTFWISLPPSPGSMETTP